jgi:ABC-type lipoprotein export system ATPase subunit
MLLDARQICRTYGLASSEVTALYPTNLLIGAGEYVAIAGPSGSGKSTLMNILGLLDRPSGGELRIDGANTSNLSEDGLAKARSRWIGFVFQSYQLLPRLTAYDNVALPLLYAGESKSKRVALVERALDEVGLLHKAGRYPNALSGGEQQRVAIARAVVREPPLVLADEPTGALDSASGRLVLDLLARLNGRGCTVILVTHDLAVAREAARVITVHDGRVVHDCDQRQSQRPYLERVR